MYFAFISKVTRQGVRKSWLALASLLTLTWLFWWLKIRIEPEVDSKNQWRSRLQRAGNQHAHLPFEECLLRTLEVKGIQELLPISPSRLDMSNVDDVQDHMYAYARAFRSFASVGPCRVKSFVFRCHEPLCGGLGDRLHGIIAALYWSLLLGRQLEFRWDFPNPISDYFETPDPDLWRLQTPDFLTPSGGTMPVEKSHSFSVVEDWVDHYIPSEFINNSFSGWAAIDVVEMRTNTDRWACLPQNPIFKDKLDMFFPYLRHLSKFQLAQIALRLLIRPNAYLSRQADAILDEEQTKRAFKVGIQHRIGDSEMRRAGAPRHSPASAACFSKEAVKLCEQYLSASSDFDSCLFFVTADSVQGALDIQKTIKETVTVPFHILESPGKNITLMLPHRKPPPRRICSRSF
jgi:hypothetical protein